MNVEHLPYNVYVEEGKKILNEYIDACAWIDSLGIPHQKTRLGSYKKLISNFENCLDENIDDNETEKRFHAYLNAFAEAIEVIRVKNNFSSLSADDYLRRLKIVTSGQTFRNQTENDTSRDYLFELSMAARFLQGGYVVDINHIADLVAVVSDRKVYVECKRVRSESKFDVRLKEANKQLVRRLKADISSHSRGIVAINLTDVINPFNSMFFADSPQHLQSMNSEHLESFVISKKSILVKETAKNTIGVLCEGISQAYIPIRNPPAVCNCRGVKFFHNNRKESDVELVRLIANTISNQSIV